MDGLLSQSILLGVIATGIRLSTPYLLAALGEMFTQRSGIYNLGLEGIMLMGAFFGFYISLHTGNAYFVEQDKYNEHITKYPMQTNMSMALHFEGNGSEYSCAWNVQISSYSGFQMLAYVKTKNRSDLQVTGMVMCVCMHHEMVPSLGLEDLQKGKK